MTRKPYIISVCSTKGGVGKSTIATFLTLAILKLNLRALLVDTDGSLDSTDVFLRDLPMEEIELKGVFRYLTRQVRDLADCIVSSPLGVDIIPSHPDMEVLGPALLQDGTAFQRFENALRRLPYDVIVIDCPGDLSINTALGLYSADCVVTPCSDGRWEGKGVLRVMGKLMEIEELQGRSIKHVVVPSKISPKMVETLRANLPFPFTLTAITTNNVFKVATGDARALGAGSSAAQQFVLLAQEILEVSNEN